MLEKNRNMVLMAEAPKRFKTETKMLEYELNLKIGLAMEESMEPLSNYLTRIKYLTYIEILPHRHISANLNKIEGMQDLRCKFNVYTNTIRAYL